MNEGQIILARLSQANGKIKLRPVLILKQMPKFYDLLVCGISTQLHNYINGFDELLNENDDYFSNTGLLKSSIIRLGFSCNYSL